MYVTYDFVKEEILSVGGNGLFGVIPSELSNLSNLRELHLKENWISGSLPKNTGEATVLGTYVITCCISAFHHDLQSATFVLLDNTQK